MPLVLLAKENIADEPLSQPNGEIAKVEWWDANPMPPTGHDLKRIVQWLNSL